MVRDDIDMFASELLREEDPDPLNLLANAILGGGSGGSDSEYGAYADEGKY